MKKVDELNFIDVDRKYNSATSEWRRIIKFVDKNIIYDKFNDEEELWQALLQLVCNMYKIDLKDIVLNNTFTFKISETLSIEYNIFKLNKETKEIIINNTHKEQQFWTTYRIECGKLVKKKPQFYYAEVIKVEKPLEKANPKAELIRYNFKKAASQRAKRINRDFLSILNNVKNSKHTNKV